jgi:hypothetical protein
MQEDYDKCVMNSELINMADNYPHLTYGVSSTIPKVNNSPYVEVAIVAESSGPPEGPLKQEDDVGTLCHWQDILHHKFVCEVTVISMGKYCPFAGGIVPEVSQNMGD